MATKSWTLISVIWPLPTEGGDHPIERTIIKLHGIVCEQYNDQSITVGMIWVGKPEMDGLLVSIAGEFKSIIFSSTKHVKPDSMEVEFLKPNKTEEEQK